VPADELRTFWTIGDLRCVLFRQAGLQKHIVQVLRGTEVLCSAFIDEPIEIEGLAAAGRLKVIFVDRAF